MDCMYAKASAKLNAIGFVPPLSFVVFDAVTVRTKQYAVRNLPPYLTERETVREHP